MGILLVSAEKIKAFTDLNENLDEALLVSNIQVASDIGLQNILGTKFYNSIKNKAQGGTLSSAETTLLQDYIQPYLIQRAYYECIPQILMRMKNKSITIGNTAQGASISSDDMKYLRNMTQDRYEFYAQRLLDYLKNNDSDFPDYTSWSSTDGMPPSKENYFGGFHVSNTMPRKIPPKGLKGIPSYLDPTSDYCCKQY